MYISIILCIINSQVYLKREADAVGINIPVLESSTSPLIDNRYVQIVQQFFFEQ